MNKKEILKEKISKLRESSIEMQNEAYELEQEYYERFEKEDTKQKYLNTYWKYVDNCYSCPEDRDDYWNMYYYIYSVEDGVIRYIELEKDSAGVIHFKNESDSTPEGFSNHLESIAKEEFDIHFKILLNEIIGMKIICNIE